MKENKYPWAGNRPYNAYLDFWKNKFGGRVQKVIVDAGFTCPNRDGRKGYGGCNYCNNDSFKPPYCQPDMSIRQQVSAGIEFLSRHYKVNRFLVYFQPYSNTYAPLDRLKALYEEALEHPQVEGLVLGTRSDCVDEEKIAYLESLAKEHYISIEYGLESPYNETLQWMRRGHDFASWEAAVLMTAGRGIHLASHVILGFPTETREQMLQTAEIVSRYPIDSLKIHHLHIVRKTILESQYRKKPFPLLGYREYVELVVAFLQRLRPDILVQRLVGETHPRILVAPNWGLRANVIQRHIEEEMEKQDVWQGKLYRSNVDTK